MKIKIYTLTLHLIYCSFITEVLKLKMNTITPEVQNNEHLRYCTTAVYTEQKAQKLPGFAPPVWCAREAPDAFHAFLCSNSWQFHPPLRIIYGTNYWYSSFPLGWHLVLTRPFLRQSVCTDTACSRNSVYWRRHQQRESCWRTGSRSILSMVLGTRLTPTEQTTIPGRPGKAPKMEQILSRRPSYFDCKNVARARTSQRCTGIILNILNI